jgi:N-acetylmuramoyl-L-alanine amidase
METQQLFLTVNPFSRPGKKLSGVKGVVVHYVGNPGTSALANRNYWEGLKSQSLDNPKAVFASAHFVVGLRGEVVQALPLDETAYHCGAKFYKSEALSRLGRYPNNCTLGVEACHAKADGRLNPETWLRAVDLAASLCKQFNLDPMKDIWRHWDVTGKPCPLWFVEESEAFERFKTDVSLSMEGA